MNTDNNPVGSQIMGGDVVGALFTDRDAASVAIDELNYAGFGNEQVGTVVRDGRKWKVTGMGSDASADDAPTMTSNRFAQSDDQTDTSNDDPMPPTSTGVTGLFAVYGFDETVSGRLSGDLEKGALLVVVKAPGRSTESKNILERNGGKMAR